MDPTFRLTSATIVRATIAKLFLRPSDQAVSIGNVSLQPHQIEAAARLRAALDEFGGGVLCDDVGMGKTFVAIAVARHFSSVLVVAPAVLRSMWIDALHRCDIRATITSFERMSRINEAFGRFDLVIVDEAHNVRNRATHRYRALRELVRKAKVVLLSATPIHNREADLTTMLELFLGARARLLTRGELSRCLIRRVNANLKQRTGIPRVLPTELIDIGDSATIVEELLALPPPLPVRDGGVARILIARGLIHQWASSEAALRSAIRKRRARGYALRAALEAGTLPTAKQLATWTIDEGDLQLGFAELLADPAEGSQEMLRCLESHLQALEQLAAHCSPNSILDDARATAIRQICRRHPKSRVIAFAQYEETARAMFRRLVSTTRVALLAARGAWIVSGRINRNEALDQFDSSRTDDDRVDRIDLLLATDILSEGVNLQRANVVVHLDTPWTAARLEQRVGRVARIGSSHDTVHVYMLRSPLNAREVLESEEIVDAKWDAACSTIGVAASRPFENAEIKWLSVPEQVESLRGLLRSWLPRPLSPSPGITAGIPVAAVHATRSGFLAIIGSDDHYLLLAANEHDLFTDFDGILTVAQGGEAVDTSVSPASLRHALDRIAAWSASVQTRDFVGIGDSSQLVHRPRLAARIDSIVAASPFHQRLDRIRKAAIARDVASTTATAAIEAELSNLTTSQLPPDAWLDAVVQVSAAQRRARAHPLDTQKRVEALLLLQSDDAES